MTVDVSEEVAFTEPAGLLAVVVVALDIPTAVEVVLAEVPELVVAPSVDVKPEWLD